ncbi:hypothetical protein CEUSTIGMA_g901.t1 [Chlamydomonas eustigma]|uniref:Uncharacterized protein n=1 Tax=Chlamydomonas eustigma TaxID=1157962 RepID=A0A250WRX6_9CHLO|nr:hypothetical protein CEUSTIGMA_g901.t1 [Chlamydomonas eustigma]|eukprot:GAX73449.1 hypothetical protein CEUSTIGMA_g901.t1 [Chlamydomonas eustigma]
MSWSTVREYRNAVGRDQLLLQKHHRSLLVVNELMQAAPRPLLSKMQAFALREGFSHMTAAFTSGSEPSPWQGEKDPLGVLLALPMSHPLSTLTWSDYRIACGSIARCLSQKRKVSVWRTHRRKV